MFGASTCRRRIDQHHPAASTPAKYLGLVARALQDFASTALFVLVYLAFIIASRRGWERKASACSRDREERQEAVVAFLRIRDGVEQYLFVQTITGLMVGGLSWVAMAAVGPATTPLLGLPDLPGGLHPGGRRRVRRRRPAAVRPGAVRRLLAGDHPVRRRCRLIGVVIGNVVYPRMQGRSLNIDPVMVLLALAFWGAIWGVAGAFLSTPLTVMAMVDPGPVRRQPLDRGDPVGRRRPAAAEASGPTNRRRLCRTEPTKSTRRADRRPRSRIVRSGGPSTCDSVPI